ncbi:Spy/CpxP family protein refolding chaperone [Desulfobacula toluolica]|uniref:Uncharacterized protein possibly related to zinc-resistance n=1 Tax=Desulfobacula toluolica (strain DSM 7467 / Tol2) TaxID=651182 RepID=K0NJM2_DESTT|nr:periplasmic heavy metal sensor [Desulfobacula toluolica]CCK79062.1 uncharacterized protein possibly related to zinc-resistance [Desulfobacula toluolica Tol2]
MKKLTLIISSLLMVAMVAGSVFAWGPAKGQSMGQGFNQNCPGYGGQAIWNDLSKEQKDELNTLRQKFIDETYAIRSEKFQKKQEMRLLMETSQPDRAKLDSFSQDLADLQKKLRDKRIDFQLEAKKIAPGLNMGQGFGRGHDGWSGKGKHRGSQGQGCGRYNN